MSSHGMFKLLSLSDLPDMMTIERSSADNPWSAQVMRDSLAAAHTRAIGVWRGSELLGYVVFSVVLDEAEVLSMTIHPRHQGKGFGKALLTEGLRQMAARGVKTVFLEVRITHPVAIPLYEKLGFVRTGVRPGYYHTIQTGRREDALLMRLSIAEGFPHEEGQQ